MNAPVIIGDATLYLGDCREILPTLEEVNAVVADPPYMGVLDDSWDNQWNSRDHFCSWINEIAAGWKRVLRANGSLWCFAYPHMAAFVEVEISKFFNVLNHIVWNKKNGGAASRTNKEDLRSFIPLSERIIFAEHYGTDNYAKGISGYNIELDKLRGFVFEPLRAYLDDEWKRAGLKQDDANIACGTASMAGRHYFSRSQWCMPTAEHYASLQRYANQRCDEVLRREYEVLRREYEDLRREYEDLRREYEDLRRPFFLSSSVPYRDVWDLNSSAGEGTYHPAQKPMFLMKHIICSSTRANNVVLDPFMGSGTTGVACVQMGRKFIGIEIDPGYFEVACRRIEAAQRQTRMELV